jgi:hypothetical protein
VAGVEGAPTNICAMNVKGGLGVNPDALDPLTGAPTVSNAFRQCADAQGAGLRVAHRLQHAQDLRGGGRAGVQCVGGMAMVKVWVTSAVFRSTSLHSLAMHVVISAAMRTLWCGAVLGAAGHRG